MRALKKMVHHMRLGSTRLKFIDLYLIIWTLNLSVLFNKQIGDTLLID